MNKITTVIFDMYETLVQNEPHLWRATFQDIVQEQRLDIDADRLWQEWQAVESQFRSRRVQQGAAFETYYEAWRDSFAGAFATLALDGDAEAAGRKAILGISRRTPYPETAEALRLVQQSWRTAVLSNADDDFLLPNLELLGVQFEAVVSSEGARVYKPRPGLFREMLRRLKVTPQESVYVGDRQFEDVKGAQEVGITTVWINRSGAAPDPELPQPSHEISDLLQLPRLLAGEAITKDGGL